MIDKCAFAPRVCSKILEIVNSTQNKFHLKFLSHSPFSSSSNIPSIQLLQRLKSMTAGNVTGKTTLQRGSEVDFYAFSSSFPALND